MMPRKGGFPLLCPQGQHGTEPGGATCRKPARKESDTEERKRRGAKDHRIAWADAEQQRFDQLAASQCRRQADRDTGERNE